MPIFSYFTLDQNIGALATVKDINGSRMVGYALDFTQQNQPFFTVWNYTYVPVTNFLPVDLDLIHYHPVLGTEGFGINNAGDVVGIYQNAGGSHGFLYNPSSATPFTTFDDPSASAGTEAFGINKFDLP